MSLVSIIIPVFNGSNYLADAIESGLAQTYKNIEIIVVNDGSNDGGETERIAHSFGSSIRYITKDNGGVSSALNSGILAARGDWIAWLSHDDIFLPDKILKQLKLMENSPAAGVCYSDYHVIDNAGSIRGQLKMPSFPRESFLQHLLQCMFVCGSTTLVKRECFNLVGPFDEKLRYAQDADMWLRLAEITEFIHINEPLIGWRYHSDQGSKNEKRMLTDRHNYLHACIKRFRSDDFFPRLSGSTYKNIKEAKVSVFLAKVMLKCHREPEIAASLYVRSIREWPSLYNEAVYLLLSHLLVGWIYFKLGKRIASTRRRYLSKKMDIPQVDFIRSSSLVESPFK